MTLGWNGQAQCKRVCTMPAGESPLLAEGFCRVPPENVLLDEAILWPVGRSAFGCRD